MAAGSGNKQRAATAADYNKKTSKSEQQRHAATPRRSVKQQSNLQVSAYLSVADEGGSKHLHEHKQGVDDEA